MRHPERNKVASQAERGQPHGGAPLPGDLRQEPVRGRDEGRSAGQVPPHEGAAVGPAAGTRILLRAAVHAAEPVHEGHHRRGPQGPLHGRRRRREEAGHRHLRGVAGRAREAPIPLQ